MLLEKYSPADVGKNVSGDLHTRQHPNLSEQQTSKGDTLIATEFCWINIQLSIINLHMLELEIMLQAGQQLLLTHSVKEEEKRYCSKHTLLSFILEYFIEYSHWLLQQTSVSQLIAWHHSIRNVQTRKRISSLLLLQIAH